MNSKLKELDIEKMLFWDLECVREFEELLPDSEAYHLYEQKIRNRETDEYPTQEEVIEHYKKKAALSPTHNKIICISMAVVSKGIVYVKSITGEQKDIIRQFCEVLQKGYIPCGFNIVGFDFPVFRQKAFKEGLIESIPEKFNDAAKKEWAFTEIKYETNIVDLMLYLKGTYFYNQSLAEACYLAGISSPKNDNIEGSKVSEIFYLEGVDRIAKYCERDVVACVHLFQRMRNEGLINEVVKLVKEIKKPLLERLYSNNQITLDIKNEVEELLKNKPPTEKEKEHLFTILRGAYIRTNFESNDQDSKKVMELKEKEIKKLLCIT